MKATGAHLIIDGDGVSAEVLNNAETLCAILAKAVKAVKATVLSTQTYQFTPQGVTVVMLLAESHISIHTYPEHGAYMLDLFTCGDLVPEMAIPVLQNELGGTMVMRTINRGTL